MVEFWLMVLQVEHNDEVVLAMVAAARRISFGVLDLSIKTKQACFTSLLLLLNNSLSIIRSDAGIVDGSDKPTRYAARLPTAVSAEILLATYIFYKIVYKRYLDYFIC